MKTRRLKDTKRKSLSIVLSPNIRAILDDVAEAETTEEKAVYASDVARVAIEKHLRDLGYADVTVEVDRGGYRERRVS